MKAIYECAPCLLRQVIRVTSYATSDKTLQLKAIEKTFTKLNQYFNFNETPAALGTIVHRSINETLSNSDPYREEKRLSNIKAIELLPKVRSLMKNSANPFQIALKAAIASNSVDFAVKGDYNIEAEFNKILSEEFAINDSEIMASFLSNSKNLLYIFDNAAEIVFDYLLIEKIKKQFKIKVTGVVKGSPILNDATLEDAYIARIPEIVDKLITIGTNTIGTILEECSSEFIQNFKLSDVIICKGMGNYESLEDNPFRKKIIFILKAKCKPVASSLGVPLNSNVVKAI